MSISKEIKEKFINDPEWREFESWIVSFFEFDGTIEAIDTNRDSTVIHAEVIARQGIKACIDKFRYEASLVREGKTTGKTRFI